MSFPAHRTSSTVAVISIDTSTLFKFHATFRAIVSCFFKAFLAAPKELRASPSLLFAPTHSKFRWKQKVPQIYNTCTCNLVKCCIFYKNNNWQFCVLQSSNCWRRQILDSVHQIWQIYFYVWILIFVDGWKKWDSWYHFWRLQEKPTKSVHSTEINA